MPTHRVVEKKAKWTFAASARPYVSLLTSVMAPGVQEEMPMMMPEELVCGSSESSLGGAVVGDGKEAVFEEQVFNVPVGSFLSNAGFRNGEKVDA